MLKKTLFIILIAVSSAYSMEKTDTNSKDKYETSTILATIKEEIPRIIIRDDDKDDTLLPFTLPDYSLNTGVGRERTILRLLGKHCAEDLNFDDLARIGALTAEFTPKNLKELVNYAKEIAKKSKVNTDHLIAAMFLHPKSISFQAKQQFPVNVKRMILENVVQRFQFHNNSTLDSNFIFDLSNRVQLKVLVD